MRLFLVSLAFFTVAFAGCADDGGSTADDMDTRPADDDSGSMDDSGGMATPTTLSCTATAGAMVISLSTAAGDIGGCNLGTIESSQQVVESRPADGCTIQYDADGDDLSDGEVSAGTPYDQGTTFVAFCDVGALEAVNELDLVRI